MFKATQNKGFQITFENGNTVSVQWGPNNYCKPTDERGRGAPYEAPTEAMLWGATTVEVAAWDSDGNWHNCGGDQVKGWLTPEEVLEFMTFVANNELDKSNPFTSWADEYEDEE
ncbi:MAG: hypothetical protein QGH77_01800 [Planctomycetota bacterium]|jgi:hypothetical protein|nr:hypothetical protein [Planctomycetota bacterium]